MPHIANLTASEALRQFRSGVIEPSEFVQACLDRIASRDGELHAFSYVDAAQAQMRAKIPDDTAGAAPMFGVPFAVKDMIDTADQPTTYNSPYYLDHQPSRDASPVAILKSAGGILLGKAATVEFASVGRVADTVNPHNSAHTPGGSSSGSAAAVAAGMVPIALGTQTGGSTIRPAAFCGVAAMKPTFGLVSIDGVRPYAPSLDTLGWFTRSVEDLALVASVFRIEPVKPIDRPLKLGFCRTPYWVSASADTQALLVRACEVLRNAGHEIVDVSIPPACGDLNAAQDVVMHGEGRVAYLAEYRRDPDLMHPGLRDEVENRRSITSKQLCSAYDQLAAARPVSDFQMNSFDAWITPATPGEAPVGCESTGLATFNRFWTALHVPCITLPFGSGSSGLPLGIQLVGSRFSDARLLAAAAVVEGLLNRVD